MFVGIEHSTKEQQAEDAWSQLQVEVVAEEGVETETEGKEMEAEQGWTTMVQKQVKDLCTSARVLVALNQSAAEVVPRKGDIPKAITKHGSRITRAWVDFRGGISVYSMYCGHSESMSTRNEDLFGKLFGN